MRIAIRTRYGLWFYSNPSGNFQDSSENDVIDIQKDLSFNSYSTFSGKEDWKFTLKNHVTLAGSAFDQSGRSLSTEPLFNQGQTFDAGLVTHAQLSAPLCGTLHTHSP